MNEEKEKTKKGKSIRHDRVGKREIFRKPSTKERVGVEKTKNEEKRQANRRRVGIKGGRRIFKGRKYAYQGPDVS